MMSARKSFAAAALVACALLLSLQTTPAAAQSLSPSVQALFEEGVRAQKTRDFQTAERIYRQVLATGGELPYVHNNLGIVYQEQGEHERALREFRAAARLDPSYAAPHILAGASLLALNQPTEAKRELERAVALAPAERLARIELAKADELTGNLVQAVEQYRRLRTIDPANSEYAYQLGRLYLKLSNWYYERLLRIDSRSARAYEVQAESYRLRGDTDLAVRALQRAAAADPTLAGVHLQLAELYLGRGDRQHALEQVDAELALIPESAAALSLKRKLQTP